LWLGVVVVLLVGWLLFGCGSTLLLLLLLQSGRRRRLGFRFGRCRRVVVRIAAVLRTAVKISPVLGFSGAILAVAVGWFARRRCRRRRRRCTSCRRCDGPRQMFQGTALVRGATKFVRQSVQFESLLVIVMIVVTAMLSHAGMGWRQDPRRRSGQDSSPCRVVLSGPRQWNVVDWVVV